jgi:uroporphyrinogen decarboxylase
MTERDNLRRMLTGEGAHHLPLDVWLTEPSYEMVVAKTGIKDEIDALGLSVERVGPHFPSIPDAWRRAYGELGFELRSDAVIGPLGTVSDVPTRESVGAAFHLLEMRHPLESVESAAQLERLPWPDLEDPAHYRHIPDRVQAIQTRECAAIGQMDCTAFEMAWYLRGMDRLYLDLLDGTGIGDWLLDWFTCRAETAVREYVRAGCDIVWLGDDVGTQRGMMTSVGFWREHLKPRLRKVVQAAREEGSHHFWVAYHSDGDIRPIIDDLIEIGIQVLNPVQPECMPLEEIVDRYRTRLAFWGMIGTQTTMPFGSVAEVRRTVAVLRTFAEDGVRIVVSPTHAIEPDVPWENLEALIQEAKVPLR